MMSKHYIYEIFGRKIGATNDVERRMKEQKAKEGEYRIIEEHTNAKICSIREIELQKEYNYPVDRIQYWKTLKMQKKTTSKEANRKRILTTKITHKDRKLSKLAYTPEAIAKRVANTDYSNIKPPKSAYTPKAQAKRIANTNWIESRAKAKANTDYKALSIKRVANTDFKEASKKRAANTNYKTIAEKLKKPVNQYDLEGNFIKRWDSAIDVASILNISSTGVTGCCKQRLKTHKKYIWKYAG